MHCFSAAAALAIICSDRPGSSIARAMEIAPTRTLRVRTASRSAAWRSGLPVRLAQHGEAFLHLAGIAGPGRAAVAGGIGGDAGHAAAGLGWSRCQVLR